jgi:hypothetical protein
MRISLHLFRRHGYCGLASGAGTMLPPTVLIRSTAQLYGLRPMRSRSTAWMVAFERYMQEAWRSTDGIQINLRHMGKPWPCLRLAMLS